MRQHEKGAVISHIRKPWWLWVFSYTHTHLTSPITAAEFQTSTSTCLHLLQELSQLPLLNCLFRCKGTDFYLFYSFGFHPCSSSHPTEPFHWWGAQSHVATGIVQPCVCSGSKGAPGKEMLIPCGQDRPVLWSIGIYVKSHSWKQLNSLEQPSTFPVKIQRNLHLGL